MKNKPYLFQSKVFDSKKHISILVLNNTGSKYNRVINLPANRIHKSNTTLKNWVGQWRIKKTK